MGGCAAGASGARTVRAAAGGLWGAGAGSASSGSRQRALRRLPGRGGGGCVLRTGVVRPAPPRATGSVSPPPPPGFPAGPPPGPTNLVLRMGWAPPIPPSDPDLIRHGVCRVAKLVEVLPGDAGNVVDSTEIHVAPVTLRFADQVWFVVRPGSADPSPVFPLVFQFGPTVLLVEAPFVPPVSLLRI